MTAMVIGPPEAEKTAREALTWGAERAVLVLKKETGNISHSAKLLAGAIEGRRYVRHYPVRPSGH